MRRLYITPKEVHDANRHLFSTHLTTHWLGLVRSASDKAAMTAWETAGSHVIVSTEFMSEGPADLWEGNSLVTVLPHPVWHGTEPITVARTMPENQNNKAWRKAGAADSSPVTIGAAKGEEKVEIDGLSHLIGCHGVMATDTIIQVHAKLALVHPAFRLRALR